MVCAMATNQAFLDLNTPEGLKTSLQRMGFETLTAIQMATIAPALKGRDLLGSSQTGTGKTAAYGIPVLAWLYANPGRQALILAPTRELATQIHKVLRKMGKEIGLKGALILGGESFARQKTEAGGDADYLIATPGRLNDHLAQKSILMDRVALFVLDEVDLMMDMGFIPQVKEIAKHLPSERQTFLFSATLPPEIRTLAESLLKDPVRATVGATTEPVAEVTHVNLQVHTDKKPELLIKEVTERQGRILIFTRTKAGTEQLERLLSGAGHVVEYLHGERTQKQRKEALEAFRKGECRILVATDIAARGLDIPDIAHVINYSLPQTREEYIHRVGRTARQGKTGIAVNFVTPRDRTILRKIGKLIGLAEPAREVPISKPAIEARAYKATAKKSSTVGPC